MIELEKKSPKYYIRIDGEQKGPFPLEELAQEGVRPSTYVWCAGMDDWEKAEDVPDICRMFRNRLHDLMHPKSVQAEQQRETNYNQGGNPSTAPSPSRFDAMLGNEEKLPSIEEIDSREDHSVPPTSILIPSIIVAVLLPLIAPIGIVGVYFAVKSKIAWKKGENDKAYDYNRKAKMCTGIAFFIGISLMAGVLMMTW